MDGSAIGAPVFQGRHSTVVDYDAWARGYAPPSEHVLIDALSYRGAKVHVSGGLGEGQWWLVVNGKPPTSKQLLHIFRLMTEWEIEDAEEAEKARAADEQPAPAA